MLPSSGYFQTINCPFYDSGLCDRPYCHYRHVRKEPSAAKESGSVANSLSNEPSNTLLGIGDDQNILEQLVSEAVKKALQGTELTASIKGDLSISQSSESNKAVSSKLVEKVIEGLKPLVAPPATPPAATPAVTSASVPSYKPTPIAELRKRHIPVPYTPKDTKTILVKRPSICDGSSSFLKIKNATTKHREEYVPGVSGKAIGSDVPTYKPFASQSYGEVQYSPTESGIKSEVLYTPSDKSSLPSKAADYVPAGLSDSYISETLYLPTIRGAGPIQEPEYQPEVGTGTATNISYTPSKLDSLEDLSENQNILDPLHSNSATSLSFLSSDSRNEKDVLKKSVRSSFRVSDRKSETRDKFDKCEVEKFKNKGSLKESDLLNGTHSTTTKRDPKEKEKVKSHPKHSSHHKDHKDQKEHRNSKVHNESKDHKVSKIQKNCKDPKDSKETRDSKTREDRKDIRHLNEFKDGNNPKEKVHKTLKDGKDLSEKLKRTDSNDLHRKSKRCVDVKEGCESEEKCKSQDSSHVESKHRTEGSYKRHGDGKGVDKSHGSRSRYQAMDKTKYRSDTHHSSEKKDHILSSKKLKSGASYYENKYKHGNIKLNPDSPKTDSKKKEKGANSFEEMEFLLKETMMERWSNEYASLSDSDTDEDIREQQCLKIFNAYKPDETVTSDGQHKKRKSDETVKTASIDVPPVKRRLAHEGAINLAKIPALTAKKITNPTQAMMKRFSKYNEQERPVSKSSGISQVQPICQRAIVGSGKIRIAHVPNVSKILDAKKNLSALVQGKKIETTISQTQPKGSQRVAHVPPLKVTRRPFICHDEQSKIPTNVRQKYLNLIFEELLKKMGETEECCKKSLYEEISCYNRSSTRKVYTNLVIIAIRRLRSMDATEVAKDDSLETRKTTLLHEDVIGGKAKAKGKWSIIPPKRVPLSIDESCAYQMMMQKYVMTEEDLIQNGYPRPHPTEKGRAIMVETMFRSKTKSKNFNERVCDRCGKEYVVDDKGFGRPEEQCVYHWGRPFKIRGIGGLETRYSCCQGEARTEGCSVWNCHISDMFDPENQRGFFQTLEKPGSPPDQVFALDCEMCYTTDGIDLLRVTVINFSGETVYDTLVKPEKTVLDYATRFSGVTEEDMRNVTKTLLDVQATLLNLFHKKTILIGHSLDSDLKALKLIHDTVVDTSMVFPHRRGPPFKRALKTLSAEYLQKIIQSGEEGHDSAEDALACIELMKWKIKEDLKSK